MCDGESEGATEETAVEVDNRENLCLETRAPKQHIAVHSRSSLFLLEHCKSASC